MTDVPHAVAVLTDGFNRVRSGVVELTENLSDDEVTYRVDDQANSIGWLVWHLTRVQDDHVADAASSEQAWPGWRQRFDLPFEEHSTGYGQDPSDAGLVQVSGRLLADYHADVHSRTQAYLEPLTASELDRVVDERWDPPVTVAVRLVSVLEDCLQHLGQGAYVRGLAMRRRH